MIRAGLSIATLAILMSSSVGAEFPYGASVSVQMSDSAIAVDGTINPKKLWVVGTPYGMNTRGLMLDGRLVAKGPTGRTVLGEFNCGVGDIVAGLDQTYNIGVSCNVTALAKLPRGSTLLAETGFRLAQDAEQQQRTSTLLRSIHVRPVAGIADCDAIPKPGPRKVRGQRLDVQGFILSAPKADETNGWGRICMLVTPRGAAVNRQNVFGALYAKMGAEQRWIGSFRCGVSGPGPLPADQTLANALSSCDFAPTPLVNLRPGTKLSARVGVTFDQRSARLTQTHRVRPYRNGEK